MTFRVCIIIISTESLWSHREVPCSRAPMELHCQEVRANAELQGLCTDSSGFLQIPGLGACSMAYSTGGWGQTVLPNWTVGENSVEISCPRSLSPSFSCGRDNLAQGVWHHLTHSLWIWLYEEESNLSQSETAKGTTLHEFPTDLSKEEDWNNFWKSSTFSS